MTAKDGFEIEVKFPIGDIAPYEQKLTGLGAKRIESGRESNIMFKGNGLKERDEVLRLRSYGGKSIITHKKKVKGSPKHLKVREETETIVDSFENTKKILEHLGYEKNWIYEKIRQVWILDGVEVLIDKLPILGNFIEIEGTEEEIKVTAKKLGLDMSKSQTSSYPKEYDAWRKKMNLPKEDLVLRD